MQKKIYVIVDTKAIATIIAITINQLLLLLRNQILQMMITLQTIM
jgi:hypothetical protein